jgi:hypothetical protein
MGHDGRTTDADRTTSDDESAESQSARHRPTRGGTIGQVTSTASRQTAPEDAA